MLHERENSIDTESFLKENGKKFVGDCLVAMKLMYQGIKLNGDTCKELYGIHDRRLRNCRDARPDIVKSEWKRDVNGKRLYVEFWIDRPHLPTKSEVIEKADAIIRTMKDIPKRLETVFELPDLPEKKSSTQQGNLFQ